MELFFNHYKRLKIWYVCKERLRDVYKAKDRGQAKQLLESLIITMRTSDDIELYLWGKTLIRYKEEILNYFVYRTTNAYTEGLHVRCKLVHCYTIVRKEGKETNFWLSLIADTNPTLKPRMQEVLKEGQEIVAIVSAIINKTMSKH